MHNEALHRSGRTHNTPMCNKTKKFRTLTHPPNLRKVDYTDVQPTHRNQSTVRAQSEHQVTANRVQPGQEFKEPTICNHNEALNQSDRTQNNLIFNKQTLDTAQRTFGPMGRTGIGTCAPCQWSTGCNKDRKSKQKVFGCTTEP